MPFTRSAPFFLCCFHSFFCDYFTDGLFQCSTRSWRRLAAPHMICARGAGRPGRAAARGLFSVHSLPPDAGVRLRLLGCSSTSAGKGKGGGGGGAACWPVRALRGGVLCGAERIGVLPHPVHHPHALRRPACLQVARLLFLAPRLAETKGREKGRRLPS